VVVPQLRLAPDDAQRRRAHQALPKVSPGPSGAAAAPQGVSRQWPLQLALPTSSPPPHGRPSPPNLPRRPRCRDPAAEFDPATAFVAPRGDAANDAGLHAGVASRDAFMARGIEHDFALSSFR
jgi:hypothetical protein